MIWKTKITQMTGVKIPLIMGAFAVIGRAEFASAFSNADGLGIITAINYPKIEAFQNEIENMMKLTDKPFGVNFTITPPYLMKKRSGRIEESYYDFLDLAIDMGVKVFTTSAYQTPRLGSKIKDAGCYWFHKCVTIKHALAAQKMGADAITLVGLEGTGFKNPIQNTTLVNITMARRLLNVPIIAAGGIGDARGFLGALAMGADAVCLGSSIVATLESPASENWKQKILNQDIFDEKYYRKIFHLELKDSPIASMAIGHIDEILPIKVFIDNLINDTEHILKSWGYKSNTFNTL
ncbi:MAG: nitronate monooxygenase [Candidatus Lokiarchaeota archaeon]|nr:nitronate monooxygenase [Candidatus Lokiarchaeota archaeon]